MDAAAYQDPATLHRVRTHSPDSGTLLSSGSNNKPTRSASRLVKSHTTTYDGHNTNGNHNHNHEGLGESGKVSVVHYEVVPKRASSRQSRSLDSTHDDYMAAPFAYRHGRRYLRDPSIAYPLPVDLAELHRQNLRTLLLMHVFGTPFCAPFFQNRPPKKVLEIACGSALWSSCTHDFFSRAGHPDVSFTGLDIAPLAPDLRMQGVDWRFVQHDLRKLPFPFEDDEFDFIFVKDTVFCAGAAGVGVELNPLTELVRYLAPGGVIEVSESDLLFRCLLPAPPTGVGVCQEDVKQAERTGTYLIGAGTPFTKAQNRYLQDYNVWAEKAIDKIESTAAPCALMGLTFSSEPEVYGSVGSRRIAIPLGELRWEREGIGGALPNLKKKNSRGKGSSQKVCSSQQPNATCGPLTPDQLALRRTALLTVLGLIEGLEPMLMKESGKKQDEWDRWWAALNTDLLERNGLLNGECLEVGAWWARKA